MGTYVLHEHMFAVKVNLNEAGKTAGERGSPRTARGTSST